MAGSHRPNRVSVYEKVVTVDRMCSWIPVGGVSSGESGDSSDEEGVVLSDPDEPNCVWNFLWIIIVPLRFRAYIGLIKWQVIVSVISSGPGGALIPKIVNGDDANIEDYPYQVSIEIDGGHQCGGSIISTTRILTAAQCTDFYSVSQISVRAGSSIREQGGQLKTVFKKFVHPGYNNPRFDNDVSVLVLSEPLDLNNKVQVVQLATSDDVPDGAYATVTGWGHTENYTLATTLQQLQSPKNSNADCKQHFGSIVNIDSMVCYGGVQGVTPCAADSGSPIVYNNVQVGVASLGICDGYFPFVYARVEYFLDYIQSNM
ncbi:hypothetical protein RN001_010384 [Aquatica leii]|uniref:Peptidase S1 domain-containing protein n=1 Tax=Aquatica leii TaxID=1421715 RepID=A0AAN7QHF2_9COLE|nr:hypothetical protein RN001_010384 [Aquatica leii]